MRSRESSIAPGGTGAAFRCRGEAPWPRQSPLPPDGAAIALPVPAQSVFEIREGLRTVMQAVTPCASRAPS